MDKVNGSRESDDTLAMFEMINGSTIIGEVVQYENNPQLNDDDDVLLKNPIKGLPGVDRSGRHGISWNLWMGGLVSLNPYTVVGQLCEPVPDHLRNTYIQITTGISIASAGDLPRGPKLVS